MLFRPKGSIPSLLYVPTNQNFYFVSLGIRVKLWTSLNKILRLTHSGGVVARNSEYVMTGELPCIKCSIKIDGFVIIKKGEIVWTRIVSESQL